MSRCRSIVASACLLAAGSLLADGWVHSPDGRTVDSVAQPLPRIGISLSTGEAQTMRECDPAEAMACGWYRVVLAAQPTNTILVSRTWAIVGTYAQESLVTTDRTAWCAAQGVTP